jgi:DNA-directed RNA polymerase subunit RPC12/RpoP
MPDTQFEIYPKLECPHCKVVRECKYEGRVIGEARLQYRCGTCKKIFEIRQHKATLLEQMPGSDKPAVTFAPLTDENIGKSVRPLLEEIVDLNIECERLREIVEERNTMITNLTARIAECETQVAILRRQPPETTETYAIPDAEKVPDTDEKA